MGEDGFPELLALAREGPGEARERLARLMTFDAHAVARRQLGPRLRRRLESVDVTQSVVWNAIDHIGDFRGSTRNELRAWLARQVVNRIRDHADHHGAQKRDLGREEALRTQVGECAEGTSKARPPTPSAAAITRERIEHVRAAMRSLSDEDRRMLERKQHGLSWAELAEEFGLASPDAARMRCVRIQNKLAERLRSEA